MKLRGAVQGNEIEKGTGRKSLGGEFGIGKLGEPEGIDIRKNQGKSGPVGICYVYIVKKVDTLSPGATSS